MRKIETSILINAPAEKVWQILTGFNEYPSWNPFIRKITGDPAVGKKMEVLIQPSEGKSMVFKPVVLAFKKEEEFRWKGIFLIPGLFNGEHFFLLKKESSGTTLLIHGEFFTGILPPLLGGMLRDTEVNFNAMNRALKNRCENT